MTDFPGSHVVSYSMFHKEKLQKVLKCFYTGPHRYQFIIQNQNCSYFNIEAVLITLLT